MQRKAPAGKCGARADGPTALWSRVLPVPAWLGSRAPYQY